MCLHRGCGKRRSQKCQKCEGQDKVGKAWELVTGIGSSCCQFPFTEFLIAAAMGHRYEHSAVLAGYTNNSTLPKSEQQHTDL